MDKMTRKKVQSLTESGNLEISGNVLCRNDGQRAIVEMGAVRWLTNEEMWALMHPLQELLPAAQPELVIHEGESYLLKPCPFCASGVTHIRPLGRVWLGMKYSEPSSVEIMHHCDPVVGQPSRSLTRVGRDVQSAVDAWNTRK
jgi:hypothetical protein